ncbi:MAG: periplasmic heavy metal sensor [Proteobacteria bacterium]|nr:periplasmic heavy metal sensor [Pseudomonadota bacterium]
MTATHFTPTSARPATRWLLLGSLALNLFFIGIAIAMAVRHPPPPRTWDRDIFVRTERLAEGLPKADRDILLHEMQANRPAIEKTQSAYRAAQESIRDSLRKEPFDINAMRDAMNATRAARQAFDVAIQSAFAGAAEKMSQNGRTALADWRHNGDRSGRGKR